MPFSISAARCNPIRIEFPTEIKLIEITKATIIEPVLFSFIFLSI